MDRADLIITTGGLGPTVDDVTREGVAMATGRPLAMDPEMLEQIQGHFRRFGSPMADNNRRQAYLPEGCIPIENPVGTAPGFIVEDDRGTIITLPGVPHEMRYLMEHAVTPYLQGILGPRSMMVTRILRTVALGESRIDRAIADLETSTNPTVGLSAHPGQTDVRIVAKASSEAEAEAAAGRFRSQDPRAPWRRHLCHRRRDPGGRGRRPTARARLHPGRGRDPHPGRHHPAIEQRARCLLRRPRGLRWRAVGPAPGPARWFRCRRGWRRIPGRKRAPAPGGHPRTGRAQR